MKTKSFLAGFLLVLFVPALALAAQTTVSLGAGSITPSTVNINAGDTVVWNNVSGSNQSVMANNGAFQSGSIGPGGQFAATFNTTGAYNYYDNSGGSAIIGEVIVGGNSITTAQTYVNPNVNYQTVGSTNSSASVASLTSEIQSLISEINSLQSQNGTTNVAARTSVGACPQIGRVLGVGSSGSDVSSLQTFLAADPSVYPNPQITGFFGSLTQAAVERWQTKYNIISSGSPSTTGYGQVGPRTAAAMAIVCGGGSYNGIGPASGSSSSNSNVVSGFIQVTPISGAAPLTVTVSATVNTANSCNGANYVLNFGDGTASQNIAVPADNCNQMNQAVQHTYLSGGTYTISLSAGSHQTTATVTVSGNTTTSGNSSQPTGSISALVTSGPPPLSTTFYISCVSGLAYDVVFGDGTDLGSSGVSQSSCNGTLQSISHTYSSVGTYSAQLQIFVRNSNGTVTPQSVATQTITVGSGGSSGSSTNSATYSPPTLTPNVGGNPLAISLQYNYDSSGCEVAINWGDGSALNPSGCSTFTGQSQTFSQSHTYSQAGSYTILLQRGSQNDSVGVSIAN